MTAISVDRPARPRQRSKPRITSAIPPVRGLLAVAALLLIWEYLGDPSSVSFPPPSTWIEALGERWAAGELPAALQITGRAFFIGLLLVAAFGISLGVGVGSSKLLDRALSPVMDFVRSLPAPVMVPLIALIVGPSLRSVIAIVVLTSIWPMILNASAARRAIPSVRLDMARSMGIDGPQRFFKIVLPSIADGVVIGLRQAVVVAMIVTLFTEYLGLTRGLGYLLLLRQQRLDSESVWGLILLVGLLGYFLNIGVALLEARVMRSRSNS